MKNTLASHIVTLYQDFLSYTTKELKQLGLSFGLMPIVVYIGKHPGCTQSDLTKDLNLDWGYSQRSISKLVDTGFIVKKFDKTSACNCLTLTVRGEQAFDVSHSVFSDWDQLRTKDLSPEEKTTMIKLLSKLTM